MLASPMYGRVPVTMIKRMTPMENTSTDSPLYERFSRTSGA